MRIRHVRTLAYYDAPQVFEARDSIGGHYIAVMGPSREIQYLVTGVAPQLLRMFCEGEMDLLSLLQESDTDVCYTTTTIPMAGDELEVEPFVGDLDTSGFMPDPGFVLEDLPSAELTAGAGGIRLELTLDDRLGRVGTGAYTGLIHGIQVLTRHVLVAVEAGIEPWRRRDVLDVVIPAAAGSFRVLLEASSRKEPSFNARMTEALRQVDALFQHSANPQKTLTVAAASGEQVAGAYRRLLQLLNKNGTGLRYAWTGSEVGGIRRGAVSRKEVERLVTMSGDRVRQMRSREGELYRCNSGTGFWGLMTDEGRVLGRVAPDGPDLGGLKVGGWYRFLCDEEYAYVATWRSKVLLVALEEPR